MSYNDQENPVCVVTGGTSGIGKAIVQLFSQHGYRIATCGRDKNRLQELPSEIDSLSSDSIVEPVDLSDMQQTKNFGRQVLEKLKCVDVLVNNAAVAPLGPFEEISEATFEQLLNVNVRSTFYLSQMIWRQMKEQGSGVVVNISSLAAVDPFPGFSIYGASKAWIDLMTQALAGEGLEHGLRVCSIRAGAVETPMLRRLFPDFPSEQCVSPQLVAQTVMDCVRSPVQFPSGKHFVVTNQP